jgi:putative nucleotidyltransferase with HDIG domain
MMCADVLKVQRAPRILVLEDQEAIQALVKAMLGARRYACDAASSLAEARGLMARARYDLLFIDVNLPDGSGLSLVNDDSPESPLAVVMTGKNDLETAVEAIRRGAIDFITKPFSVGHFLQRVDKALEEWSTRASLRGHARALQTLVELKTEDLSRSIREIDEVHDKSVLALGAALKLKDNETEDHCARVSANSVKMGSLLNLSAFELKNLKWGAYLHDVGKIGIPEQILLKPGPLTAGERRVMEKHPVMGYAMVRNIQFLVHSTDVVLSHHERYDGAGYPFGLQGVQIPLHARIFSIMDTLDAMTSDRPYHQALPSSAAAEEVQRLAGSQFDPEIVEVFLAAPLTIWLVQDRVAVHD